MKLLVFIYCTFSNQLARQKADTELEYDQKIEMKMNGEIGGVRIGRIIEKGHCMSP